MRQKGSVLITALFLMVLVAMIAISLSTQLRRDISQTSITLSQDPRRLAADQVLYWAIQTLIADQEDAATHDQAGTVKVYPKQWAKQYPGVVVTGAIKDCQARFNVNNLQDRKYQTFFYHLLYDLDYGTPKQRYDITHGVTDWVSLLKGEVVRRAENIASPYLAKQPPHYPAFQAMENVTELRLITGIKPDLFNKISPYLTALPEKTMINVNTAPKRILKSLGMAQPLYDSQVDEIIATREERPFTNQTELKVFLDRFNIPDADLTFESDYFLSVAQAKSQGNTLTVYSLLKRTKARKGKIQIQVLKQSWV